ncbi:MAG: hypothetical protein KDI07_11640 [Anaerolineae bacterium]|nr:hypothetical protein [Anaerolineae bacterium]MCB9132395.1 hypothetical protein [Anaerolineales bacterium]MCB0227772.1 hypothetical protein [Anaerolineae bacterium]MCB0233199.1 hypothetical protein [Anaerolineae bacterium]MCB0237806.1 hypothetical protein [Anaerolineae bacterium]
MDTLDQLEMADFAGHLNESFAVQLTDGDAYALELIEVSELSRPPDQPGRQPFALIFRNARTDAYLAQATHLLTHEDLGSLSLFLVPLGPQQDGMHYEALFT